MGLVQVFRRVMEWGWFWSGCPLVVLIALPALVMQTRHLAGPFDDYQNQTGLRAVWYQLTDQIRLPFSLGLLAPPPVFSLHCNDGRIDIYAPGDEHACEARSELGSCYDWYAWRPSLEIRGPWAPTQSRFTFFLPSNINDRPSQLMPKSEFELAMNPLAESYEHWCTESGKRFDQTLYAQLKQGRARWSEPIYAGYAHNALAVFLLGMTGRGVFGSRRWWRSFKARFRLKKNCCVTCGYGLEGLVTPRCPECGEEYSAESDQHDASRDQIAASGV